MSVIKPFRGLRPVSDKAENVASPPYDVLNSDEARNMAKDNPFSLLHVTKPEIDLPPSIDLYADEVYAKGAENFKRLAKSEVMIRDEEPCFYVYEQRMRIGDLDHVQVGLVAGASVDEYQKGLIKKHELTRMDKEKDRTRHVEILNAQAEPVFLTYKADPKIDEIIVGICRAKCTYDFTADDGISHRFWVVSDRKTVKAIGDAFALIPHMYVADGHHRSAAASLVRDIRKAANQNHTGNEEYNYFLSVIFPHNQMHIMEYNRVVADLNGLSQEEFLAKVKGKFEVSKAVAPKPSKATEFGMYLGKEWFSLKARPDAYDSKDPVASLDVSILQKNLLDPVLGIKDPRKDKRIDFVGGIRGTKELERRVKEGAAVAFALFPTSISQLMKIADSNEIMPPKSTWFEPKLRSGLAIRMLD